jgi:hypothetical protein
MFARQIADKHNAYLLSDIAHISGLISAKVRSPAWSTMLVLGWGLRLVRTCTLGDRWRGAESWLQCVSR